MVKTPGKDLRAPPDRRHLSRGTGEIPSPGEKGEGRGKGPTSGRRAGAKGDRESHQGRQEETQKPGEK